MERVAVESGLDVLDTKTAVLKISLKGTDSRRGLDVGVDEPLAYEVADADIVETRETGGTDYVIVPIQHMWYKEEAQGLKALAAIIGSRNRDQELEAHINAKGHQASFLHRLVKLVREEGGRVEGGVFKTPEGYVRINASKGVVMACGGYASNLEMLEVDLQRLFMISKPCS